MKRVIKITITAGVAALGLMAGITYVSISRSPPWQETCLGETTVGNVVLTKKRIELDDGNIFVVDQGAIQVPEVRNDATARSITIGFWVLRGTGEATDAPVYMLPGGPGNSYIESFGSEETRKLISLFRDVGDVVLVDLRGINLSTPNISGGSAGLFSTFETEAEYLDLTTEAARAGRKKLVRGGFDLTGYNVIEAADDVVAIADALGHENINLYGTSFGSHWSLTVARQHPNRVHRFVVDGVEGFDHTVDDSDAVADTIARIALEASPVWNGAYDVDDPFEAMQRLFAKAEGNPDDAFGLQSYEVATSLIQGQMLGFDYALGDRSTMARWPADIANIMDGNGAERLPIYRLIAGTRMGRSAKEAAVGLFDCASWISDDRNARLRATAGTGVPDDLALLTAKCEGWGVVPLSQDFRTSFVSDVRGLFVQGTYDVKTPYQNVLELLPSFPNADLVTVHGGSHEAMTEALEAAPAFAQQLREWYTSETVPADVTLPAIAFTPCPICDAQIGPPPMAPKIMQQQGSP